MSKQHRMIYYALGLLLGIIIAISLLKYFGLYWVESNTDYTKVTINFLFPMEQSNFQNSIQIISKEGQSDTFQYATHWINRHTVELVVQEGEQIKGQKVVLKVNCAQSMYPSICKSMSIPIQFKTDIKLTSPSQFLVSSTNPFIIGFNTPISLQQLCKSLQCETEFDISPCKNTDDTQFVFVPKKALSNGESYALLFKAGMCAKSGTFLREDQAIIIKVDEKPTITKTYPINGDKWIGLYPRILLESKEDMVHAEACINGITLVGKLIDSQHAYFLTNELLQPETSYHLSFQIETASGEKSDLKQIDFTTTTLSKKRFWLDIHVGNSNQIKCYEGTQCIRTIPFEISKKITPLLYGTYYLQNKSDVYEDNENHLGGNYWMSISNQLGIQGTLRDAYWQPISNNSQAKNMIITDEDAAWLYERMEPETMIIVRE